MFEIPRQTIHIQEVGMRDGLQSAGQFVETAEKIRLINQISKLGFHKIEVTSFVSPKAVPLLADAEKVLNSIDRHADVGYTALIPNIRGLERALSVELDEVNVVMSVSEAHNMANLRMSRKDSLNQFNEICKNRGTLLINGTLATAFGCPFTGDISGDEVIHWGQRYLDMGMDSLTLADTVGTATPRQIFDLCSRAVNTFGGIQITLHLHNTRGLGVANALAGIAAGIRNFDSSVGGIGGCPYAPGATGNVCTEDLVHALVFDGYSCKVDLEGIINVSHELELLLPGKLPGSVRAAGLKTIQYEMSDELVSRLSLIKN